MAAGAAFVLIAAGAIVTALVLRPGEPAIDSQPARERFDVAYRALDDDLEGDYIDGCPSTRVDVIFQAFVRSSGRVELYDVLDRGSRDSYVFFDGNVDRPLLQCGAGGNSVIPETAAPLNNLGLTVTRPYEAGFEQFMDDLLSEETNLPEKRCTGVDVEQLDDYADGEVYTATCRHQKDYEAIDFRQVAWMSDDLLVLFAVQGTASDELEPDTLREALIAALPGLLESIEGAEVVEPAEGSD